MLAEQAHEALYDRDGRGAQALLEQALAISPNDPSLINNLIIALEMQGRTEESRRMIQDLHARFPDYFFGIVSVASLETAQGNLARAHEMLNDLMQRDKMHPSEFAALCQAQIQVWLAEKNREAARTWLEMWEKIDPEHPNLAAFQLRVGLGWKI
jgi:ATP/maltotriose-dependent transcriptional regulator MalT